jgi:hypothetical protein
VAFFCVDLRSLNKEIGRNKISDSPGVVLVDTATRVRVGFQRIRGLFPGMAIDFAVLSSF